MYMTLKCCFAPNVKKSVSVLLCLICSITVFGNVVYMRSQSRPPYNVTTNEDAMNTVFGRGNWQDLRYETALIGSVFSNANTFIFLEMGDNSVGPMTTFLNQNLGVVRQWVSNGGRLFINGAATSGDSQFSLFFGDAKFIGSPFDNSLVTIKVANTRVAVTPIFLWPNRVNGPWTGTTTGANPYPYAATGYITGTGLTPLLTGTTGLVVLATENWGQGQLMFGSITPPDVLTAADNDAVNLLIDILTFFNVRSSLTPAIQSYQQYCSAAGNAISLAFNISDYPRDLFLQLSDPTGSFASGTTNIGNKVNEAQNIISGSQPSGLAPGNYRIRLSSNFSPPVISPNNGADIVVVSNCNTTPDVPVGTIMPYGGTSPPQGYLFCDGASYPQTGAYNNLYLVIGTNFGGTDVAFNVPDLRGMFVRGVTNTSTNDPDVIARYAAPGGNSGNNVGSIQKDELKSHNHITDADSKLPWMRNTQNNTNSVDGGGNVNYDPQPLPIIPAGGHETRPKNVYVNYIIKYALAPSLTGSSTGNVQTNQQEQKKPRGCKLKKAQQQK